MRAVLFIQLGQVFKVAGVLRHERALLQELDFVHQIVDLGEALDVGHELGLGDAGKRVLDFAGDVVGHGDDAGLAHGIMVGTVELLLVVRLDVAVLVLFVGGLDGAFAVGCERVPLL